MAFPGSGALPPIAVSASGGLPALPGIGHHGSVGFGSGGLPNVRSKSRDSLSGGLPPLPTTPSALRALVVTIVNTMGQCTENISIVYIMMGLGDSRDVYAVLLFTAFVYPLTFGIWTLAYAWRRARSMGVPLSFSSVPLWKSKEANLGWCCGLGLLNSLNGVRRRAPCALLLIGARARTGVFVVFASPATRTPPVIAAIVGNMSIAFSIPASVWWLPGQTWRRYTDRNCIVSVVLIIGATGLSLVPMFEGGGAGSSSGFEAGSLYWPLMFIVGCVLRGRSMRARVCACAHAVADAVVRAPAGPRLALSQTSFSSATWASSFLIPTRWRCQRALCRGTPTTRSRPTTASSSTASMRILTCSCGRRSGSSGGCSFSFGPI